MMYISLITWERHELLEKSLASLSKCDFPPDMKMVITDDKSADPKVLESINGFKEKMKDVIDIEVRVRDKRLNVDANNVENLRYCLSKSEATHVICLESDGLYNKRFLFKFLELRDLAITRVGMLTLFHYDKLPTTNENFKPQLRVKGVVGAFCTMFHRQVVKELTVRKGFDWAGAEVCKRKGMLILCSKPSYAQHLGSGHPQSQNSPVPAGVIAKDFVGEV